MLIAYATYILGALFFEGNKRSKIFDMNVVGSSTTIFLKSLLWQLATIGSLFHCRISDGGAEASKTAATSKTAAASKTAAVSKMAAAQEEQEQEEGGQEEQEQEEGGQEEQEQEEGGQEEQEQEEDIFNLIIGQEIENQQDEVKGGGDNDLYNYFSSNEDELFKSVQKKYKGKRKR